MICPSCGGPLLYQPGTFKAVCDRCAVLQAANPPVARREEDRDARLPQHR
jgi:hypothetical protein